jgi:hypothetical protein
LVYIFKQGDKKKKNSKLHYREAKKLILKYTCLGYFVYSCFGTSYSCLNIFLTLFVRVIEMVRD